MRRRRLQLRPDFAPLVLLSYPLSRLSFPRLSSSLPSIRHRLVSPPTHDSRPRLFAMYPSPRLPSSSRYSPLRLSIFSSTRRRFRPLSAFQLGIACAGRALTLRPLYSPRTPAPTRPPLSRIACCHTLASSTLVIPRFSSHIYFPARSTSEMSVVLFFRRQVCASSSSTRLHSRNFDRSAGHLSILARASKSAVPRPCQSERSWPSSLLQACPCPAHFLSLVLARRPSLPCQSSQGSVPGPS